jgi:protein tyrosine/serine phosphatase
MLFRSGSLDRARGRNLRMALDAHLRTAVDLRPDRERAKRIAELPGTRRVSVPLDIDRVARERLLPFMWRRGAERLVTETIVSVYRDIVTSTTSSVKLLFETLADPGAYPVCINCRAGKDRTGYAVALVLRTLGVAQRDIITDYLATNHSVLRRVRRFTRPLRLLSAGILPTRAWEAALAAHETALRASFDVIDGVYGGIAGFLDSCGVGDGMRTRVRAILLE